MCAARQFFCDCQHFCGGTLREVGQRTYYTHAPHRRDRIRTALGDFLAQAGHQVHPGPDAAAADHDVDMSDSDDSEEDDAPNVDAYPEDDYEDLYADDPDPEPPRHVGVAFPEPRPDPYVEPVQPDDQDRELPGLGGAADAEVCIRHRPPTKLTCPTDRTGRRPWLSCRRRPCH